MMEWMLGEPLVNEDFQNYTIVGVVVARESRVGATGKTVTSMTIRTTSLEMNMEYSSTQEGLEAAGWKRPTPLALDRHGQIREDV
jgi:hypothetical protein